MSEEKDGPAGMWLVAYRHGETGCWLVTTYRDEEAAGIAFDDLAHKGHSPVGPYPISEEFVGAIEDADDDLASLLYEFIELTGEVLNDAADVEATLVEPEEVEQVD